MRHLARSLLAAMLFFFALGTLWGQVAAVDDPPKPYVAKKPPTRKELDQRESMRKYAYGLAYDRDNKFQEALSAFEEAARLDPDAPAVFKAQIPILIVMDRMDDALAACKKVVDLDPEDFFSWYVLAKLNKSRARYPQAIEALERGVRSDLLSNHPEAAQQMYFEMGSLYEGADKFAAAADAFTKAAKVLEHPDLILEKGPFSREAIQARAAETYEKIGQLYRKAKQYDSAIAALRKAQDHAPDRAARISFHMAEIGVEAGNLKQALTFVDVYLRSQPLGLEAYQMKIGLLTRLKQQAAVVPWLEEAAKRDRWNNGLHLMLAKEYVRAKQPAKAEAIYQKLAEESPSPDLYRGLFHLYKQDGASGMPRVLRMLDKVMVKNEGDGPTGYGAAAKAMVGALRDDGELATALVQEAFRQMNQNQELKFDTIYLLAMLADRHKQGDEAELFYRKCLPHATPANEAVIYGGLLRALNKARKFDAVVEICRRGLKSAKATNQLLFFNDLARGLANLHRYDEALLTADKAWQQAGDDQKLIFKILRVRILSMADRFEAAESECQALLKTHTRPNDALELRYLLSNIYAASKQQAKSEEQLQIVLKIDPANPTANNDLGYLWADQNKNLVTAEAMIRKAIEQDRSQRRGNPNFSADDDKDHAAYVDSLGWVLFRRGQIDEARKELERATTLGDGDDPVIYDHLGDVYNRLKMRPEAGRAWQRALELYNQGIRNKEDDRVRDIQRKINEVKEDVGGR